MSLVSSSTQALYSKMASLLPAAVPYSVQAVFLSLVLLNIQSFPTLWHIRVLGPFWAYLVGSRVLGKKYARISSAHPDPRDYKMVRNYIAWPTFCDVFGFHLSNSSYAYFADELRGPHTVSLLTPFFDLPSSRLALGSTAFAFKKDIGIMQRYSMTQEFIAHDKKWVYMLTRFTSKSKSGAITTHALCLSHICLKLYSRRTVKPNRAFALSGFGEHGAVNSAIVAKMSIKERMKWLVGETESEIIVGDEEYNLEAKENWLGDV